MGDSIKPVMPITFCKSDNGWALDVDMGASVHVLEDKGVSSYPTLTFGCFMFGKTMNDSIFHEISPPGRETGPRKDES